MKGIQACVEMAQKNGWSMSIVVVDRGEDVVSPSHGWCVAGFL